MDEKDLKDGSLYEYRYRYKARRSSVWFYSILIVIVIAALGFRMYWTSTFGGVYVDGESMAPTLHTGDELLMKYGADAKRGDVIVVDVRKYHFTGTQFLIKRLIALEGDALYCEDSQIYIRYAGTEEFVPYDDPHGNYAATSITTFLSTKWAKTKSFFWATTAPTAATAAIRTDFRILRTDSTRWTTFTASCPIGR